MKKRTIFTLYLLFFPLLAWGGEIRGTCYVTFFGTSTLHDFTGTVRSRPFTIIFKNDDSSKNVIPIVTVDVPVDDIDTDNGKRDKKMRKMFQSDRFPLIRGEMRNIPPISLRDEMERSEKGDATVDLTLKIRDVERVIPVRISNFREYTHQISFDMEFPVSLDAYGLKPPAPLFGLIRVADRVDVKITFDLEVIPAELFGRENQIQGGSHHAGVAPQH